MGRDKAWLPVEGTPVIERVVDVLKPLFWRVRVIAKDERFAVLGVPVQPDLRPGAAALGGLHTALATAEKDVVFVAACDLPFLSATLVRGLAAVLADYDAALPWTARGPEPLVAFYRRASLSAVERALDRNVLRVGGFLEELRVRRVEEGELARLDPGGLALLNLNTPEDYARALQLSQPSAGSATRSSGTSS